MSRQASETIEDAWSAESYDVIGRHYLPMAARLVRAAGVDAEATVLDIGTGTGNVAITAARRGASVTGLDVTSSMLERARERAAVSGLDGIEWREGSATDLPFETDAFDVTLSALGHMYAQPPSAATEDLLRVTEPGGTVAFTAWTPASVYPTVASYVAAALPEAARPDFSSPPFAWGDPSVVRDRLEKGVDALSFETRTVEYPAVTSAAFWEEQLEHSDVIGRFVADVDDRAALREQVVAGIEPFFDAEENVVELEYLETTATVTE